MKPYYLLLTALICALAITAASTIAAKAQENPMRPAAPLNDVFVRSLQALGGETGNGVALGDLDDDGDIDAFVANDYSEPNEANHVWCNQGDGFFVSGPNFGTTNGHAIALGDLDGDNDLDAVIASATPNQVWINKGTLQGCESLRFDKGQALGAFTSYGVALGDVDNDADLDVLLVGDSNEVWLNNGDATFVAGPTFPFQYSKAAALVDLDGDSFRDAVITDSGDGDTNQVWWNDGNWNPGPGSFTAGAALPTSTLINGLGAGHLDADNHPDLFLVGSGQNQIFWNEGTRTFTTTGVLPLPDNSFAIALADLDNDGDLDGVVANGSSDPNRVWRNDGSRVFTMTQEFGDEFGFYWGRGLGLADLNGDNSIDLFEVTTADDHVWFNAAIPILPNEVDWQIQSIAERGDAGRDLAMRLDANNYPHIAYVSGVATGYNEDFDRYEYTYGIHYARWDGVRWHNERIAMGLNFVNDIALVLDENGYAHIVFAPAPRYIRWNGDQWQEVAIPATNQTADAVSIVLDSENAPHIFYEGDEDLKHLFLNGATWQEEMVDEGEALAITAVGKDGELHLTYTLCLDFSCSNPHVRYARKDAGAWTIESVGGEVPITFGAEPRSDLVFDAQGQPHITLIKINLASVRLELQHAYRDVNSWHLRTVDTTHFGGLNSVSIAVDTSGAPHLFYNVVDYTDHASQVDIFFKYARWTGSDWQIETLDTSRSTNAEARSRVAMAIDAENKVHATYYEPKFGDLRYLSQAPPWQIRTLTGTGVIRQPALDVENGVPYIAYYDQTGGQIEYASWHDRWIIDPITFVSNPVTDLGTEASALRQQLSYYDADNRRLLYRYRFLGVWHTEVVDESGDVGRYNDLVLVGNSDAFPRIAYWDATTRRIKLAVPDTQPLLWSLHPNLVGPPLDANSGMLSAAVLPGADIGVAYYDAAQGDLRLAVWDAATATWTDELIEGATGDVGRLNSLQTDATEGVPVVAYFDQTASVIKVAHRAGTIWQIAEVRGTAGESIVSLSLELGLQSRTRARVAYATASGVLNVAILQDGIWRIQSITPSGFDTAGTVASARDSRIHLAYPAAASGLRYAFHTPTLDIDMSSPDLPPSSFFADGYYNPLDACQALLDLINGETVMTGKHWSHTIDLAQSASHMPESMRLASHMPESMRLASHIVEDEPMADLAIFAAMTPLFAATPEGQHYIDLYLQHGAEMGQLGLEDPQLLMDASGTLQNFLPGLEALVAGKGEEIIATQQMVNDVLALWQRIAAAGSPQLSAAIHAELAKHNNLQDFVHMSFDGWAEDIGVTPPPDTLFLPALRP